jgi:bifunctional non-homologous end joining protein LigD
MEQSIRSSKALTPCHRIARNGIEAFDVATRHGYEGLVAKDVASPYVEGRSTKWLKVKVHQEDEFVIIGFTEPTGSRKYFGALLLGAYDQGKMRFVRKVGTGFNQKTLGALYMRFQPLVRKQPTFVDPPRESGFTYLAPRLVAHISFQEWTRDRKLRQPVFLGLRDDKDPQDMLLPEI